jgi:hypothetical protein
MLNYYDIIDLKMILKDKIKKLEKRYDKQESLEMYETCKRINSNLMTYQSILDTLKKMQLKIYLGNK